MVTRSAAFLPIDPKTTKVLALWLKVCDIDGNPISVSDAEWVSKAKAVAKELKEQLKPDGEDLLPSV